MAQIDVSDLMVDPDFVDAISIVTRLSTVDAYGQNSLSETTATTVGSVQPIGGKALFRLPEALRVANLRSFWIKGEIKLAGAGTEYPDILVFQGKRYQVQTTFDWMNFGQGYTEGTCVVETPTG